MTWYNELDPFAAAWLENLAESGEIEGGKVDRRSIAEITAADLEGVTRAHFFAGIGGWDYALRLAGWPSDRPVWTGSCPCQPFSQAGRGLGEKDPRHLWPEFRRLIATCKPMIIFGEQVASAGGREWLSNVRFDLERIKYWAVLYENMQQVRTQAQEGCLPKILWEIVRRVTASMPGMSEKIREVLERSKQEISKRKANEAQGKGQGISEEIYSSRQSDLFGFSNQTALQEKENPFQSGSVYSGNKKEDSKRNLRSKRGSSSCRSRENSVQQPIDRQNKSERRIPIPEYTHCVFCDECGNGELGGGKTAGDHDCLVGRKIADDQRKIADGFEKILIQEFELLRLAGVRADLEALGYAVGAADLCAAGIGAPHIRQRLYWVAHIQGARLLRAQPALDDRKNDHRGSEGTANLVEGGPDDGGVGDAEQNGRQRSVNEIAREGVAPGRFRPADPSREPDGRLEHPQGDGREQWGAEPGGRGAVGGRIPNPWADSVWLPCRDGKARRIKSGLEPLAHGVPARVGRLRGYGNAIVPQVAAEFVKAFMEPPEAKMAGNRGGLGVA